MLPSRTVAFVIPVSWHHEGLQHPCLELNPTRHRCIKLGRKLMMNCRGGELFKPAFFEYLVADGAEEKPKLDRLLKEFQGLDDWLGEKGTSYFGGEDVCASECSQPSHMISLHLIAPTGPTIDGPEHVGF